MNLAYRRKMDITPEILSTINELIKELTKLQQEKCNHLCKDKINIGLTQKSVLLETIDNIRGDILSLYPILNSTELINKLKKDLEPILLDIKIIQSDYWIEK